VHLLLAADDSKDELTHQLASVFDAVRELRPGLFSVEPRGPDRLPYSPFVRQVLPNASAVTAKSIKAWASLLADSIIGVLPDQEPWALHVFPFREVLGTTRVGARAWHSQARRGAPEAPRPSVQQGAGDNRCRLIVEALVEILEKRRRHLLHYLRPQPCPFTPEEALVQLVLTSPEDGYLSLGTAPLPFAERHLISPFPAGQIPLAVDKQAPSRAFAKLVEAELRLGRRILPGERCVDLGASPGSWTYVAVKRGAKVVSVDRTSLRADLMQSKAVRFHQGDAFTFEPAEPVDWLLCDVIAAADRSLSLLKQWLQAGWCRHFVVTLKLDDARSGDLLTTLLPGLPELDGDFRLTRLCANKKEVCAFGSVRDSD
jgi:23S rRNA (cytidine2498-2'-O)-methyltransferase